MSKNCLTEYLTNACKDCSWWVSSDTECGCSINAPIMTCPAYAEMQKKNSICKNCAAYDRIKKICIVSGQHVARKNECKL